MTETTRLPVVSTALRVLTFRIRREELLAMDGRHLAFGLVWTWLVGMGRYWDDPGAKLLQHLGLGSVLYVLALSAFLWLLMWPLCPEDWSFRRLLTFVSLVSPPAALYAIPVERFLSLDVAREMNFWFLAVVATWRVGLLGFYLTRLARLRWYTCIVATLLPLTVIVTALTALNLERAVFDIMSGMRSEGTANDAAYAFLFVLTMLSMMSVGPLLLLYGVFVAAAHGRKRRAAPEAPVEAERERDAA
ncbi:hypothetical protein P2318_01575 [Myxococcaceae bacterium GXIMD 01537]